MLNKHNYGLFIEGLRQRHPLVDRWILYYIHSGLFDREYILYKASRYQDDHEVPVIDAAVQNEFELKEAWDEEYAGTGDFRRLDDCFKTLEDAGFSALHGAGYLPFEAVGTCRWDFERGKSASWAYCCSFEWRNLEPMVLARLQTDPPYGPDLDGFPLVLLAGTLDLERDPALARDHVMKVLCDAGFTPQIVDGVDHNDAPLTGIVLPAFRWDKPLPPA